MRAFITLNKDSKPVRKGSLEGVVLPYMTKVSGFPLFEFDTDQHHHSPEDQIDAIPGMVGMNYCGELHVVTADETVVPVGGHFLDLRDYRRYVYLMESQRAEAV